MKISKNIQGKKYIYFFIISSIIFTIILGVIIKNQSLKTNQKTNEKIIKILNVMKEENPDLDEEIIKIINEETSENIDSTILKQYGIIYEDAFIRELQEQQNINLLINIIIVIISYIVFILAFIIYIKHRQKRIDNLDIYIQKVSKGNYLTNIEEYSEDELNGLKDSLYKITVMLKEEAENKKQQNKAILNSVSDISHQLKTPLTSIQILLDNILDNPNMDTKTRNKFLLEITKQIKGMNFLILSLLKLSRLDAGVVEFKNENIELRKLVEDVLDTLDVLIDVKQIIIERNIKSNPTIKGDYNWNKEAVLNIIKNAIEHTPNNKKVIISLDENDVYTSILIQDEGDGIKEENIKHIFDRFYKTEGSGENSIGIGLSLAKTIIEKQNGYIQVESKVKHGTTFKIKYLK